MLLAMYLFNYMIGMLILPVGVLTNTLIQVLVVLLASLFMKDTRMILLDQGK